MNLSNQIAKGITKVIPPQADKSSSHLSPVAAHDAQMCQHQRNRSELLHTRHVSDRQGITTADSKWPPRPKKAKEKALPPQDPAKALHTTQVAVGSRGPWGRHLNTAAGPRGTSTPEPPSALESAPTLHPTCACSQIEKWTDGNALVSAPTEDTLLTTLLSRRHSATPSPPPTAHPLRPVPSHCPTGSRGTGALLKGAQRESPSPRVSSGNSSANMWGDFPPSCPPPRGTCCFCLHRAPGGFMAVHGMGPRALLNRTTKGGWRSLGTDSIQPRETLPATSRRLPPHPHPTEALCSLLSCCPRPSASAEVTALMGRTPVSAPHPTAQAVGGCKTLQRPIRRQGKGHLEAAPSAHATPPRPG